MDYPILDFKDKIGSQTEWLLEHYHKPVVVEVCSIVDGNVVVYKYWSKRGSKYIYKTDTIEGLSFKIHEYMYLRWM